MNEKEMEQLPFEVTALKLACYEACGKPITLKNGAKMHPEGWLKFLKLKPEDILG